MKKKVANTLVDFKTRHDRSTIYINKIKEGLKSLAAEGPEAWENEGEFIRRCGLATHQMSSFREQFKDHWIKVPRRGNSRVMAVWFGNSKVAAKARGV
jgi:hypothetical protein